MQCIHCLQRISQHSIAYARGSKDSGVSLCEQCMNQFSAQYREQKYGALIFKSTDEMYIGLLGHACSKLDPLGFTVRKMLFQRV